MAQTNNAAIDIAKWMVLQVKSQGELHQNEAVASIENLFGSDFVYENRNGNLGIDLTVLRHFRKFSGTEIVWDSRQRLWRLREQGDEPTRKQP